ncbi:MAG: hypothetical protein QM703_26400 [Gemmatales bacterium]
MYTRLLVGLALLFPLPGIAQDKPLALQHARIHPASGPVIEDGTLVIHQGKIVAIGVASEVTIPDGAGDARPQRLGHHPRPRRYSFPHRHLPAPLGAGPCRWQRRQRACAAGVASDRCGLPR